ncbi:MAG TPA: hypothetical protein VGZ73_18315 [Bryobacteraceae bacterium]|nr:hypothetical protein [Bryobacteraceae bacterium]
MIDSRRSFLHSAVAAAGLAGAAATAETPPQNQRQRQPGGQGRSQNRQVQVTTPPQPASGLQVPTMKFGGAEISRLICGCNTFYGFGHFNQTLATVMREYFTAERVCEVLHQCNRFGINTFNYYPGGRGHADLERFLAEGGKMHLIAQGMGDPAVFVKTFKPLAVYHHGETTDRAFQTGAMNEVKEWCKKVRAMGTMVGVGTHKPEVIAMVEEQGWDVDFYAGCVYNRTRTTAEWKQVLNGELIEMQGECYLQSDPARMYKVMRTARKPCFAFKIMAAGRITDPEQAFRSAFESIKPNDGVFIGLFPRAKDEVRENAERVQRILLGA